jgi:hypothetical protein
VPVFHYNGDGQRVKSVINTDTATTTTYFPGNHHEVANDTETKYEYGAV